MRTHISFAANAYLYAYSEREAERECVWKKPYAIFSFIHMTWSIFRAFFPSCN